MTTQNGSIPYIDPNVQYVGVSKLRSLNATNLHSLDKTLVVQDDETPIAVILSYDQFMKIQQQRQAAFATLEMVLSTEESSALLQGLRDVAEGKVKSLDNIRQELAKVKPN